MITGEVEVAGARVAELEAETARLRQLAEKLEDDLLAADTGGGGSNGGRLPGVGADGEGAPCLQSRALLQDVSRGLLGASDGNGLSSGEVLMEA